MVLFVQERIIEGRAVMAKESYNEMSIILSILANLSDEDRLRALSVLRQMVVASGSQGKTVDLEGTIENTATKFPPLQRI